MIRIKNISSTGALSIPALRRVIAAGETADVADHTTAAALLEQVDNFQLVPAGEWPDEDVQLELTARDLPINGSEAARARRLDKSTAQILNPTDPASADDTDEEPTE